MRRIVVIALFLAACGPDVQHQGSDGGPKGPDGGSTGEACSTPGATRCADTQYQTCTGGTWNVTQTCTGGLVCAPNLGCAACNPEIANTCVGDDVHVCNADGTVGAKTQTCPAGTCAGGQCAGAADCTAAGVKLIYVVDDTNDLMSFDPSNGNKFTNVSKTGNILDCPAGPAWDGSTATPFSMSVDRQGIAWILYSSGEIFQVSTSDDTLTCTKTAFSPGDAGFELFGMGFVADAPMSNSEKLFIAGGSSTNLSGGNLGYIDPADKTLAAHMVHALPSGLEYSPELTGTGNAELYGYFPGTTSTYVAKMDQATAGAVSKWNLPPLSGNVTAWAFAQWGGRFYIFVTTQADSFSPEDSQVWMLDPASGAAATRILDNIPYKIVGAGVSTCAPVVIN